MSILNNKVLHYPLTAARESINVKHIFTSTDDEKISEEAKKYGAIRSLHDTKEELYEAAYSLAETLASKERHSLVLAKKSLNSIEPIDIDAGFKVEQQISMNIDLD